LLPCQPPKDGTTSPPAARICAIAVASAPPVSGRVLSHAGEQPPPESTNAIVNQRTPVALMTEAGFCGLPQPRYRYGAPRPPPCGHPVVEPVADPLRPDSPLLLYAATV
jgi:hypothetical protein